MDYRSFNVRMRLHTQGCTDTARESALNVDSGRKIPYRTRGNRTCLSGVLVQRSTNWTAYTSNPSDISTVHRSSEAGSSDEWNSIKSHHEVQYFCTSPSPLRPLVERQNEPVQPSSRRLYGIPSVGFLIRPDLKCPSHIIGSQTFPFWLRISALLRVIFFLSSSSSSFFFFFFEMAEVIRRPIFSHLKQTLLYLLLENDLYFRYSGKEQMQSHD